MHVRLTLAALLALSAMTACNLIAPDTISTPTVVPTDTPMRTVSPTATSSPTPSRTPTQAPATTAAPTIPVVVATRAPVTQAAPTEAVTPTETPGPYVHRVQSDETLGFIIQQYGYGYSVPVMELVVQINPNVFNMNVLPIGQDILIPRQTATPIPEGLEITQTAASAFGEFVPGSGGVVLPRGSSVGCYTVQEGDTTVGIAEEFNTTLEIMSQLNPQLNWSGCAFNQYSGGERCRPRLAIGDCVNVPQPTQMPSATPTLTGNETATPLPTYAPPRAFYPPDGAIAAGTFDLEWVTVGVLQSDETYLVEVENTLTGETWREVTRSTALRLPAELIPTGGEAVRYRWRVVVAERDADGRYSFIGEASPWRSFTWQSR